MRRTDRPQKAGFKQLGDYWFKSLSGFCGQGIYLSEKKQMFGPIRALETLDLGIKQSPPAMEY